MKAFIVATPLFDSTMTVQAYRLCDRSGDSILDMAKGHSRMAGVFNSPGLDLIEKVGIEPFAADRPLFAEVNRLQLLTGTPTNLDIPPDKLICILPPDLPHEEDVLARLQQMGYSLAVSAVPYGGTASPLLAYVQYIFIDYNDSMFNINHKMIKDGMPGIVPILMNVPDMAAFERLGARDQNALFSGQFYNQPITQGVTEISPVKINALQLLRNVNEEDFELSEIVKIVERDPSLSISLLRFINSGAVNLSRKVDSINSAVAILGQNEVRRWATVAISVSLAEDRPGEITRLSLIRAKFAEDLAGAFELGIFQLSLFMTGLFSLLDVILQMPMAGAIDEVAVNERVRKALVDHTGELYPVLELIFAYERADWDAAGKIMIQNNIKVDDVNNAFVNALVWYHQLLESIDEGADGEGNFENETKNAYEKG